MTPVECFLGSNSSCTLPVRAGGAVRKTQTCRLLTNPLESFPRRELDRRHSPKRTAVFRSMRRPRRSVIDTVHVIEMDISLCLDHRTPQTDERLLLVERHT
jgi:hypothetical protein